MENKALFIAKDLKDECCKEDNFGDDDLCIDCEKKFKPVTKCCPKFVANPLEDPAKTKQCCGLPEYSKLDVCLEKCTLDNCGLDHCKSLDKCVC